ncbi:hypothetical protein [Herbaspirillum sp. YR522]|uniref:hypothetical protein n=1 Tax=Herbaspirillum sp. YR522 TaxID=1144342 RepID=UPI00026F99B5|nr:hypothetical protein [Herbaspirillum sp. YR522]EJN07961.1 hypothetical protein PMI40_01589 [Herbaspirillum sp. YR522]
MRGVESNQLSVFPVGELVVGTAVHALLPVGWSAAGGRWQRDTGHGFVDIAGQHELAYVLQLDDLTPAHATASCRLRFCVTVGDIDFHSAGLALPSSNAAQRYMIASNRFGLATEWGITDTGWKAGDGTGRSGGNGTLAASHFSRRYKFSTTWAATAGRFLWLNAANSVSALLDGMFPIALDRVEIRDAANGLVDTVKWGGATSKTLAPGERSWNDPIADLAADSTYFLDVLFHMPSASGAWPADQGFFLAGESARDAKGPELARSAINTAGVGSALGGYFAPAMLAARGWDGERPVVAIFGDSIEDGSNVSAALASPRGDIGFVREALGDTGSGAWNYMHLSRWASSPVTLYTDNLNNLGGRNLVDALDACMKLLQREPMFNAIVHQHGRNALGGGNALAAAQNTFRRAYAKMAAAWPQVPIFQTTITPYTTAANNTRGTTVADQAPVDLANTDSASGSFRKLHEWLMAGVAGGAALTIDTAAAARDPVQMDRWGVDPYQATLVAPVAAATTNVCRVSVAPAIGDTLVFEPGTDNVDTTSKVGIVTAVTRLAERDYQVVLNGGRRSQANPVSPAWASRIIRAHAVGAELRLTRSHDLLHPSQRTQWAMRDILVAHKPFMKQLINSRANQVPQVVMAPGFAAPPRIGMPLAIHWGAIMWRPHGTLVQQILRDGVVVASGSPTNAPRYTPGPQDRGATLSLQQIATNAAGTVYASGGPGVVA